jgi:phospholipase/carboxylesterase
MQTPDTVEVTTGENPTGSVIWLHGLGADGHDFEPIVPELRLPEGLSLRFVFPHAPVQPVTVNGGMAMRSWYDILSFDSEGRADREGLLKSSAVLDDLITTEIKRGIEPDKIVIAGFSQGGAVAIHTALQTQHPIAGLMALSTYMALPEDAKTAISRRDLPIFMAHGVLDPVLQLDWGRNSANRLTENGYTVDWHEYSMAHAVCPEEIADISQWLTRIYS